MQEEIARRFLETDFSRNMSSARLESGSACAPGSLLSEVLGSINDGTNISCKELSTEPATTLASEDIMVEL